MVVDKRTNMGGKDSVTLEEIENVQSFVDKMDKLELPNQLVAVLADPLLQKLLLLRPSAESFLRVANWLNAALQDVLDGDADDAMLWEIMEVVRDFVVQTKVSGTAAGLASICLLLTVQNLPSTVLNFFARFFSLWSGSGNKACIFEILAYTPLHDFQGKYFSPCLLCQERVVMTDQTRAVPGCLSTPGSRRRR